MNQNEITLIELVDTPDGYMAKLVAQINGHLEYFKVHTEADCKGVSCTALEQSFNKDVGYTYVSKEFRNGSIDTHCEAYGQVIRKATEYISLKHIRKMF